MKAVDHVSKEECASIITNVIEIDMDYEKTEEQQILEQDDKVDDDVKPNVIEVNDKVSDKKILDDLDIDVDDDDDDYDDNHMKKKSEHKEKNVDNQLCYSCNIDQQILLDNNDGSQVMCDHLSEVQENYNKYVEDYNNDDDNDDDDDDDDVREESYKLLNEISLLTINSILEGKRDLTGSRDGRRMVYKIEGIINDIPDNYFSVKADEVELTRLKYFDQYTNTPAKKKKIQKTLESNIFSTKSNDNMCVINALKRAMMQKQTDIENDDLKSDFIDMSLDKDFLDVLNTYNDKLTRLKVDNYETLIYLCKDLLTKAGVIFNIYQYSPDLIDNPMILKTDNNDEITLVKSIPISYLYPVFIATEELNIKDLESKKITNVLNLVYNSDDVCEDNYANEQDLEIEMKYISDVKDFFKIVTIKLNNCEDGSVNKKYYVEKALLCDKCFEMWSSKRKSRYQEHAERCYGKYNIPFIVTDKLYKFDRHDSSRKLPITFYYDFETTTGINMIPTSYSITSYVNDEYVNVKLHEDVNTYNFTTVKTCWMTYDELKHVNLPDFLKIYITSNDKKLMRKYATITVNKKIDDYTKEIDLLIKEDGKLSNNMVERNYAIIDLFQTELMIICKCYAEHFKKISEENSELPTATVKEYYKENVKTDDNGKADYGDCYVCGFKMEKQIPGKDIELIHEDLILFLCEKQHAKLHMKIVKDGHSKYILYDLKDFKREVVNAIKISLKLIQKVSIKELYKIYRAVMDDDTYEYDIDIDSYKKTSIMYKYFNNPLVSPPEVNDFTSLFNHIIVAYNNPCLDSTATPFLLLVLHEVTRRTKILWAKINEDENAPEIKIDFITEINKFIYQTLPVLDHDHYNPNVLKSINGYCHNICNNKMQNGLSKSRHKKTDIPKICIFAHNAKFDQNFFMTQLKTSILETGPDGIKFSGDSVNTIKSIKVSSYNLSFQDTFLFIQESLEKITNRSTDKCKEKIKLQFAKYLIDSKRFKERYGGLAEEEKKVFLSLITKKATFPYEIFTSHAAGRLKEYPIYVSFGSVLRNTVNVSEEGYWNGKKVFSMLKLKDMNEYLMVYNALDTIQLAASMEEFFLTNHKNSGLNPKNFSSMSQFSCNASLKESRVVVTGPQDVKLAYKLEESIKGGYSDATTRVVFDNRMLQREGEEERKIQVKLKPFKEEACMHTNTDSKEENKNLFSTGVIVDQVSQYSTMMTKSLTIGRWEQVNSTKVPTGYKSMKEWICKHDFDESEDGFFFEVIIKPTEDLESPESRSTELFNPVLKRMQPDITEVSPYQLLRKREKSSKNIKGKGERYESYKKLNFNESTLSRYDVVKENVFAQLLQHVVRDLGFEIVKILSIYSFKQSPWLRQYINNNQERRKRCLENDDIIGSNSEKLKNNTCFGGHSVSSKRPILKIIYDYSEETTKFNDVHGVNNNMKNPWLVNEEHIVSTYQKQYMEEKAVQKEKFDLGIIDKGQYDGAVYIIREKICKMRDEHIKGVSKLHVRKNVSVDKVIEYYHSNKTFKDVFHNQSAGSSVKAIISKTPSTIEMMGRAVGSMILQLAKRDISTYLIKVIKLFHKNTRPDDCKEFMNKYKIEECHVYMGATDTDSAKLQIIAVTSKDTDLTADVFAFEVRRLICLNLTEMLDLSDEYMDKFNVRNPASRKKLGTFCFDEINGVSSVTPENQLKLGIYLGPKKYYESSFCNNVKMKHAGTSGHNKQICVEDYTNDLEDFDTNLNKMNDYLLLLNNKTDALISLTSPLEVRRVVQNMLKRNKNGTHLAKCMKVVFSGIAFKRYMMGDGITTLPYGHPLLKEHVYKLNNKNFDNCDYLQNKLLIQKVEAEQLIYEKSRPLYIQKQLYNTGKVEGKKYKIRFLESLLEEKDD